MTDSEIYIHSFCIFLHSQKHYFWVPVRAIITTVFPQRQLLNIRVFLDFNACLMAKSYRLVGKKNYRLQFQLPAFQALPCQGCWP